MGIRGKHRRMNRLACFACSLLLIACGADRTAVKRTSAVAPTAEVSESGWAHIEGGARAITLFRAAHGAPPSIVTLGTTLQVWSSDGQALDAGWLGGLPDLDFLDRQGEMLWLGSQSDLREVHGTTNKAASKIELPKDTKVSAIEVGYQGTVFVADAQAMRILAVSGDKTETLIEGDALGGQPSALLLNGGSLIVATADKLLSFNIKSGEIKTLSEEVGGAVALAHDHLGYYVAATAKGEIRQVQGGGSSRLLHTLDRPAVGMVFDMQERKLYVVDSLGVSVHDYLELTGEDSALWATRDQRLMHSYEKNGMTIAGGEYWPSHGVTNVSYPDDILWGFYPSPDQVIEGSASKVAPPAAAIACAETSYRALQAFVDSNPAKLHRAAEASKASKQFYLWVNDYSDVAIEFPHKKRPSRFWYWKRDPAVTGRVPGFWKWETTLMDDGSCNFPQAEQIDAYLSETITLAR